MNAIAQQVPTSSSIGLTGAYADMDAGALLRHLRERSGVHYFPVPDAEETRADKIEAIMNNRFELNGESFDLAEPIDWLTNPSADVEWHILLHKFYYSVGLGMRYRATGDARYVVKWMALTQSWIERTPVGFIAADVTGRRVQNWIYAFHYFVTQAPAAPVCAQFVERFLSSLRAQVNFLCDNLTPTRNHRTLELYAVFLASIVFPEFADAQRWRELSIAELSRNIDTDLLGDGVHCELSTDYHHLVLKNFLNVRRLAQLNHIAMPAAFDARLMQGLEFSMYAHKPDGIVPSLSDGDARSFLDLLHQGAELYGRDDMRYVASAGAQGIAPRARSRVFKDSGYCVLRSGWGSTERAYRDEHYLILDCGPLGAGNHGHFDCLSFELAAYGQSLVVDPGRYTYSEAGETNWRVAFRGTAFHNTVTVDGKNQTRYEPRVIKDASRHAHGSTRHRVSGPAPEARVHLFTSGPGLDLVVGSARSNEYDAVHQRHIAFVFDEYWLICDRLTAADEHDYDLRLHFSPAAEGHAHLHRERTTVCALMPNLVVAHEDIGELGVSLEPGYVSFKYGEKLPAPVLRLHQHDRNARFHSVLYPYRDEAPQIQVRELHVHRADLRSRMSLVPARACALRVSVMHGDSGYTDTFFFSDDASASWRSGGFHFSGSFAAVREDAYGDVVAVRATRDVLLQEARQVLYRGAARL